MDGVNDRRILLATDFSKPAERAYAYGAMLVKVLHAKMVMLNVLQGPPGLDPEFPVNTVFLRQLQEESDREMAKCAQRAEQDALAYETRQVYGTPADCIARAAKDVAAELIVMGTHGHTGWNRLLLGSNAEAVVRGAPCPVLTVRMPDEKVAAGAQAVGVERLLVPVDFSEFAQEAFEYAAMLAKQLHAKVRLVHAMEEAAYPLDFAMFGVSEAAALRGRIQTRLRELVSVLQADGIEADSVCEVGVPVDVLTRHAQDIGAGSKGAVVMGTHGRRGLPRLALGSVAEHVVRHAACPVFTVKSPRYRYGKVAEVRGASQNV